MAKSVDEKFNLLKQTPLFKYTPDFLLHEIAVNLLELPALAGEVIVQKSEFGNRMYIIAEGKVKVHDGNKFLAELSDGDVFGELAALFPEERIASVTATEDTILIGIDHDTLYSLMSKNVELTKGIIEVLCQRTRNISKLQNQIIQQEKLASLGRLSTGIAHEIKNPLNFVINLSEVCSELIKELVDEIDNGTATELKESLNFLDIQLNKIKSHGKRVDDIIQGMLQHAYPGKDKPQLASIPDLIDQSLKLTLFIFGKKGPDFNPQVTTKYDPNCPELEVFPHDLVRVFINIVDNACFAMKEKQKEDKNYEPRLEIELHDLPKVVRVCFKNNGGGISQDIMDSVFQPFFTTKPIGEGTGLGLSISYDIVTEQHGGKLEVFSDHKTNTEFVVTLPKNKKPSIKLS